MSIIDTLLFILERFNIGSSSLASLFFKSLCARMLRNESASIRWAFLFFARLVTKIRASIKGLVMPMYEYAFSLAIINVPISFLGMLKKPFVATIKIGCSVFKASSHISRCFFALSALCKIKT